MRELLTIKEARDYATEYVGKNVTPSNISYLVQYGKVRKFETNGVTKSISMSYCLIIIVLQSTELPNGKKS